MKIYQKVSGKVSHTIKIFHLPVYTKRKVNGMTERKCLFGLHTIKDLIDAKQYYILGIRYKKRRKSEPLNNYNFDFIHSFIMEYFCAQQQVKYQNNPLDIKSILKNSKSIIISVHKEYLDHSHGWIKYLWGGGGSYIR